MTNDERETQTGAVASTESVAEPAEVVHYIDNKAPNGYESVCGAPIPAGSRIPFRYSLDEYVTCADCLKYKPADVVFSNMETATTCGPAPKVGFRSEGKAVGGWVEYEMEVEEIISNPDGVYSSIVTKQVRLRPLNKPAAIQGCDSEKDTPTSKPSASTPSTANISAPDPANSTPGAQMLADAIDTIMDEFDFAKVHKMMTAVDWRWARCDGFVPNEWDIRKMARQQLRDAATSESGFISSGGFESRRYDWGMSLKFVGADWDAEF
jgi:hypothetical protein